MSITKALLGITITGATGIAGTYTIKRFVIGSSENQTKKDLDPEEHEESGKPEQSEKNHIDAPSEKSN